MINKKFKIKITHLQRKSEIELNWDADIHEVADAIKSALEYIGFHKDVIKLAFSSDVDIKG